MPTAGALTQVDFEGTDAAALADGFYYNRSTAGAVEVAGGGLVGGATRYTIEAVETDVPALAGITAPGAPAGDVEPPTSLSPGSSSRMSAPTVPGWRRPSRSCGNADTSAMPSSQPGDAPPAWASELGDYSFQPSAAGHSLARIDALFRQLLDRQAAAAADGPDASLVAAVGDEEQFATAASLIATELGFPSRVVVGVRLAPRRTPRCACPDGGCRGRDVTAWIEVHSAEGDWVPVDVTPQHTEPIDSEARGSATPRTSPRCGRRRPRRSSLPSRCSATP